MLTPEMILQANKVTGNNFPTTGLPSIPTRADEIRALGKTSAKASIQVPEKRTLMEKVAGFTGGEKIGQGLGQAIANHSISKDIQEGQQQQFDTQTALLQRIKEKKARGEDTSKLSAALDELTFEIEQAGENAGTLMNQRGITGKQVLGDALQLGTTIASAGTYGKAATASMESGKLAVQGKASVALAKLLPDAASNAIEKSALPTAVKGVAEATSVGKGILQGAKTGAISGAGYGTATGVAQGLKEDKDLGGIAKSGLTGGAIGGAGGAIIGGIIGGISGGLKGRALRKEVLSGQIESGEKTATELTPAREKAIEIAKQQGIDESDVEFITSMKPQDKIKAQKMIDLAEKASSNKRTIERPIDIVGDSMTDRIKFIQKQNSVSGKEVNAVAKSLRGQTVDATPITQKAESLLDDLGITRKGKSFDFNKSVFKNIPELQNKIKKFIKVIPKGEADAFDVHIFKKSIDEIVDYGVKGEGLKGNAARVLKVLRGTADDVLDSNFPSYNVANTDFKATRDVLDVANDLFGKKVGIVKERGGQLLRSVFSNNTQRPRVMALVEQLDKVAKNYGGKFDDNLVDQALFTEILEDIYGTQATTSLQGQVSRALHGASKVIEGIKNPLKGAAHLAELSVGITPENKKRILQGLLK